MNQASNNTVIRNPKLAGWAHVVAAFLLLPIVFYYFQELADQAGAHPGTELFFLLFPLVLIVMIFLLLRSGVGFLKNIKIANPIMLAIALIIGTFFGSFIGGVAVAVGFVIYPNKIIRYIGIIIITLALIVAIYFKLYLKV